jgi:hypothetical protein
MPTDPCDPWWMTPGGGATACPVDRAPSRPGIGWSAMAIITVIGFFAAPAGILG